MATIQFATNHTFVAGNDFMSDHDIPQFTFNLESLPGKTVAAFVQRGINHVYGNVVQSAAYGAVKKEVAKAAGFDTVSAWEKSLPSSTAIKNAVKAWRDAHKPETTAIAQKVWNEQHQDVLNGMLEPERVASDGTPRDPVEAEMRSLATTKVREILAGKGLTPKRDFNKVVSEDLILSDGNGGTFCPTMNDLISRRIASDPEGYKKAAEAAIAARARVVSRLGADEL